MIKLPPAYDTSYWEIVPDFAQVSPRPLYVATKATEGTTHVDPKFVVYWQDLKQDGIRRGCYHFFRKALDAIVQARHFCNTVRAAGITDADVLEMDFEEGGETANQLIAFLSYVRGQFPRNLIMIYSRKLLMNAVTMTTTQAAYISQFPVWVAGYPANPDLFDSVPGGTYGYIPDQNRWGKVWMWQYTENAIVQGIQGEVDCNWLAPEFVAWLGTDTSPQEYQQLRRYDSDVYVLTVDPRVKQIRVTNTHNTLITPRLIAAQSGAKYVLNGDMWDRVAPYKPQSLAASDGNVYQPVQRDFRPFLNVKQDGSVEIAHYAGSDLYNVVSGVRYILTNGAKPTYLSGTDVQYIERQPRTLAGITASGRVVLVVVDGRSTGSRGVTLSQGADILIEYGCTWGIDLDGGGSSQLIVDGALANVPMDIDGVSRERAVINHVCIFEEQMANYEVRSASYDMSLRVEHAVSALKLETIARNTVMLADVLWVAPADGLNVKAGDKWAHVTSVNGQAKDGWVAVIHMGQLYCTYVDNAQTPAPASDTIEVYVNGVLKVSGTGTFVLS